MECKELVKAMVDRFLSWKLPKDFAPDAGISFVAPANENHWPVGTNLLTAEQAKQMFQDCMPGFASAYALGWRDELPDEQGYWWWWDMDGLPVPVYIAYSGTDGSYFATPNQLGWNRHQMVKDMGGLWMRLPEPETP